MPGAAEYGHLLSPLSLATTATRNLPKPYVHAPHLELLSREIVELIARRPGGARRLLVTMPPRHGKSELCSHWTPVWQLALDPSCPVILCSYEAEFAAKWGRLARRTTQELYPILGTKIMEDSRAAHRWETPNHGGMTTAGVGGPITGKGFKLGILDDPIKNAEDANSSTMRENLWEWWQTTFLTREEPDAVIILIMCMTGDTPVLMADGTETPLRDVRPGDGIATYEDGRITTTTVKNWANQGPDSVLEIRTKSGTVVRANARHPFLVAQNGSVEWRRTDTIKKGDRILRVTGVSGAESSVPQPGAIARPSPRGSACRTTTRTDGRKVFGHHLSTLVAAVKRVFGIATASASRIMSGFWPSRAVPVPCAANHLPAKTSVLTGTTSSVLTTATTGSMSEVFSATTAILRLATGRLRKSSKPRQSTYGATLDPVVSITDAGIEDVFDIEVDRTSNFIANGLVSHNTRWHESDLGGRIMNSPEFKYWRHINLPALAQEEDEKHPPDVLGRDAGEALWPERFDEVELENKRAQMGSRAFESLYQQNPTPPEGAGIKRLWWKWYDKAPKMTEFDQVIQSWDPTFDNADSSDYVVGQVWGRLGRDFYLLDCIRERLDTPETIKAIRQVTDQYPEATRKLIERSASGFAIIQLLQRELRGITPVGVKGKSKTVRLHWGVNSVAAVIERGQVYLPRGVSWAGVLVDEAAQFPHGAHDDMVDAMVQGITFLMPRSWGWENEDNRQKSESLPTDNKELLAHEMRKKIDAKIAATAKQRQPQKQHFPGFQ